MHIAILTFDGFNEMDSFVALTILNRNRPADWRVSIACPTDTVTSMNGVTVHAQCSLADACHADAVIVGSGKGTRQVTADPALLSQLKLDPKRQLIGAQCSGALLLAKLGLLTDIPACTDVLTKPWVVESGIEVIDRPFFAAGNVATAGGCLASQYLAAWILARSLGVDAARDVLSYVAPVGEQAEYVNRALQNIAPSLPATARTSDRELSAVN